MKFILDKATLPGVVGRGGSRLASIRENYDVRIELEDVIDDEAHVQVTIEGHEKSCEKVKTELTNLANDISNTESIQVHLPSYMHRHIIGPSGSGINTLILSFGGPEKVKIQFSDGKSNNDFITITAVKSLLPSIEAKIREIASHVYAPSDPLDCNLSEQESYSVVFNIPKSEVGKVLEGRGRSVSEICGKNGVTILVENVETDEVLSQIKIIARKENRNIVDSLKKDFIVFLF